MAPTVNMTIMINDGALPSCPVTDPGWLPELTRAVCPVRSHWGPDRNQGRTRRSSAVLVLFSREEDPSIVFTVRSRTLKHHPGQISFPGGGQEPDDQSPMATALREAREEVGLDEQAARVVGELRADDVRVSHNRVVPVVALSDTVHDLTVVDRAEVEALRRWPLSHLIDPTRRVTAVHPSGYTGVAWDFPDGFLWGFTAKIVDSVLALTGWEQPWDIARTVPIPQQYLLDVQ